MQIPVSNGIMVGDNIKDNSSLNSDLFSIKKTNNGEERYIFQIPEENFHYTQWELNWQKYLRKRFKADENTNFIITQENFNSERAQNTIPPLNLNFNLPPQEPFTPNKPWIKNK